MYKDVVACYLLKIIQLWPTLATTLFNWTLPSCLLGCLPPQGPHAPLCRTLPQTPCLPLFERSTKPEFSCPSFSDSVIISSVLGTKAPQCLATSLLSLQLLPLLSTLAKPQ